jgi:hypothetical protein
MTDLHPIWFLNKMLEKFHAQGLWWPGRGLINASYSLHRSVVLAFPNRKSRKIRHKFQVWYYESRGFEGLRISISALLELTIKHLTASPARLRTL